MTRILYVPNMGTENTEVNRQFGRPIAATAGDAYVSSRTPQVR